MNRGSEVVLKYVQLLGFSASVSRAVDLRCAVAWWILLSITSHLCYRRCVSVPGPRNRRQCPASSQCRSTRDELSPRDVSKNGSQFLTKLILYLSDL